MKMITNIQDTATKCKNAVFVGKQQLEERTKKKNSKKVVPKSNAGKENNFIYNCKSFRNLVSMIFIPNISPLQYTMHSRFHLIEMLVPFSLWFLSSSNK